MATRTLTVVLAGDAKGAIDALDKSESAFGKFGKAARIGALAVAGGLAAAGVAGVALGKNFVDLGTELTRMADRTGHSVEQLDIMRQVANRAGLDLEDMVDVTEEMRIKANDTASGIETYAEFFKELGINAEEYLKLSPDKQFNLVTKSLNNVEDATRRTIIADELLSDTGKRLLQATQSNADGFAGLAAEVQKTGNIMSDDAARASAELTAKFDTVKESVLALANEGIGNLIPHIITAVIWIETDLVPALRTLAGEIREHVLPALGEFAGFIKDEVIPVVVIVAQTIGAVAGPIIEWIRANGDLVKDLGRCCGGCIG